MLGELNAREIDAVLHTSVVGRIGCHSDGRTYIVPITYAYDGDTVYAHSAAGTKVEMMRANPAVCFEVEQLDDLASWRTVVAWGEFEEPARCGCRRRPP
ncbi:pyridoxamine 5'-phosphate oxidase family protein [Cryobacterium breve]|uniref:Pyridoxamine 5'-phosphate oxidase family protein n=1 Tax=Cryobacterium breve TaxID=1259258 RepID=A0ABY7NA03_9MICO|nr:pyridoxamine 5'-phosphate oxidase family protein [Cryobacterium breve]WBM79337.1 pyridoxamine 5'-phosphate oxidase family protein [Cryobacterium breve]